MFTTPTISNADSCDSSSNATSPVRKKAYNKQKIAIGVNTFKELVEESTVFIDKSLLIKEFIKNSIHVVLITCPRRWGKSVNMDMIKTFLEIEVDDQGNKYDDKSETSNYKLFQGTCTLPNLDMPLNIAQDNDFKEIYDQYQGEYPVISVDFKDVKGTCYQEIEKQIKIALHDTFKQHKYMIDIFEKVSKNRKSSFLSKKIATESLKKFKRLYCNEGQEATTIDIETSLKFLSAILHRKFGKEVFILMDEYDTPINNIFQSCQFAREDTHKTLMLFNAIMGDTFKGNIHLEKGLITGVVRIAKSSDFNNVISYNVLNNEFARYYGFTEDEITFLFDKCKILKEDRDRAMSWYGGYRVTVDPTLKIYNPWAIVNFLHHEKIANYWEDPLKLDVIMNIFKVDTIKVTVQSLLSQEDVYDRNHCPTIVNLDLDDMKFNKEDLIALKELFHGERDLNEINNYTVSLFFRYIFAAGYLTITEEQKYASLTSVRLPNKEVELELAKILLAYYRDYYDTSNKLVIDVLDDLDMMCTNNDLDKLKKALEDFFKAVP